MGSKLFSSSTQWVLIMDHGFTAKFRNQTVLFGPDPFCAQVNCYTVCEGYVRFLPNFPVVDLNMWIIWSLAIPPCVMSHGQSCVVHVKATCLSIS